jgi:hypothetical protein
MDLGVRFEQYNVSVWDAAWGIVAESPERSEDLQQIARPVGARPII